MLEYLNSVICERIDVGERNVHIKYGRIFI